MGIATHDMDLNTYLGGNPNSVGYYEWGGFYYPDRGANPDPNTFSIAAGDIVDIAVDRVHNMIWGRVNGGLWNGVDGADPAANAGGFSIDGIAGIGAAPLYPAVMPTKQGADDPGNQYTIQGSAAYTTPDGFRFLR